LHAQPKATGGILFSTHCLSMAWLDPCASWRAET